MPRKPQIWAAFLEGKESPGTRASTAAGALAALVNYAPEPFATVLWERHRKRGWKVVQLTT